MPGIQQPGQNILDDCLRFFGARIVIRYHHPVGKLFGNATHKWALTSITVATAAKHAPQLPLAMQASGFQRFFQGIRGVGVIDHHRRFAWRIEDFHPATDRL
ncbi:hypothetical protein D3C80_2012700 [compost metagenome]